MPLEESGKNAMISKHLDICLAVDRKDVAFNMHKITVLFFHTVGWVTGTASHLEKHALKIPNRQCNWSNSAKLG